jgi:tetraacyldisaccharide 4'-kinase
MTAGTTHVLRWLWWSGGAGAQIARFVLLPLSLVYGAGMWLRALLYARGVLAARPLPLPSVALGGLSVGGAGKTPLASWVSAWCARRGITPGVLLRGYGEDEQLVHRRAVPAAVVVPGADRVAAGHAARAAGAALLVLDDAYQRLDVARDLNIVVLNAELTRAAPWLLPAGPWREGWRALGRASAVVVTFRTHADDAERLAERVTARWPGIPVAVAHLRLGEFRRLISGAAVDAAQLAGARVVAAAGIADPVSFRRQLEELGADVQLQAYQDHYRYDSRDVARLVQATGAADYVVVTEKDAVKLRHRWPPGAREPLVALLAVAWTRNGEAIEGALAALAQRPREVSGVGLQVPGIQT